MANDALSMFNDIISSYNTLESEIDNILNIFEDEVKKRRWLPTGSPEGDLQVLVTLDTDTPQRWIRLYHKFCNLCARQLFVLEIEGTIANMLKRGQYNDSKK